MIRLTRLKRKLIFFALTSFLSKASLGRIVDVSSETTKAKAEGLSLVLEGMYESNQGNTDRKYYSVSATARYDWPLHQVLVMASSEWGVLNSEKYLDSDFLHSRYRYHLLPWLNWGVFAQVDRSPFRGLSERTLLGSGPSLNIRESFWQAHWGLFYMVEKEEYIEGLLEEKAQENRRLSTFISLQAQWNDRLTAFTTTYYQPKLTGTDDYRLLANNGISLSLSPSLSFQWILNMIYDSHPPEGIEKQDYRITQSLKYEL